MTRSRAAPTPYLSLLPIIVILLHIVQVTGYKACTSPRPNFQDGLCYAACKPGYSGRGPLCWANTPCGPKHTDTGLLCNKNSYGRGAGTPAKPTCRTGQDLDGLLCYPACRSGYDGVGPVCWQRCPSGFRNDGAFCAPDSYGRGVGQVLVLSCRASEELNGLLCYSRCRSGYYGVGPVCWQSCPSGYADHGATCFKSIFKFFFKKTYGRGAGRAADNGCRSGQEKVGALCYPTCRAGYTSSGLFCRRPCPSGMTSIGISCAKDSYGRTAGVVPDYSCASGKEKDGLLCYPQCRAGYNGIGPVCWAIGCPAGMTDTGVACAKETHGRGAGTVPGNCDSKDFTRVPAQKTIPTTFMLIIANDPQLVWWTDGITSGQDCNGDSACKQRYAEKEAVEQVRAMNSVEGLGTWPSTSDKISKPLGVIINGDLTAFFHPHQYDLFEKYYVQGSNAPDKDVLQLPVYLSLGNHDYDNNVNDCFFSREPRYGVLLKNGCAQKAVDYMKGMISCGTVEGFMSDTVESYHAGSLAYSWNMRNYHFIQLQNYPTYTVSSIGISSSMGWLKKDLDRAKAANRKIIINLHDLQDHFKEPGVTAFKNLISSYDVVGIFCGHVIGADNLGYQGEYNGIPYFRGGHAGQVNRNKFLLVEFAETYYKVASITSVGGVAKFHKPSEPKFLKTITF